MAKKIATRVVTIAATKGGVGKTTLCTALAVRAAQEFKRVALFDNDPQMSARQWWSLRGTFNGDTDRPRFVEVETSAEAMLYVVDEGRWDWVFIDTPPGHVDAIEQSIYVADFVIVPVRPSMVDLFAQRLIQQLIRERQKAFAFLINAAPNAKMTMSAIEFLGRGSDGNPAEVLETVISNRIAYMSAMTGGRSGPEIRGGEVCAQEIDALWAEVKRRVHAVVTAR